MSTPILIARVDSPGHHDPTHPENPERFAHFDRLTLALADSLKLVATSPAKIEEVGRVHTPAMLSFLQQACQKAGRLPLIIDPAPTFAAKGSWQAALQAAGAVLELVRAVMAGSAQQAFALVRPPGHHAEPAQSKGFCLINNLAVGVAEALAQGVERVAVVDFDAHHGNGTQAIFWKEPRVGFFSSHQEHIYPGSGALEEAPHARGRIINLPLPAGAGDLAFEQMADQVIEPWLAQVRPQIVFVSAGFDAHWTDPLTSLGISTEGYFRLAQRLAIQANRYSQGRMVWVLEGGYDPATLADNVEAVLQALAGLKATGHSRGPSPYQEPDIRNRLERLKAYHGLNRATS
jgi:acetoin utilization deacetylase AcuC-like enzyme